jgi:hypothetical protein
VKRLFELVLVARLLFPFFDSPLTHIWSDPQRHWDNAALFLHPNIMGSSDPYLYQLWLFAVRWISNDHPPVVQLACGLLCAAMPIGWYGALRELLPKPWALVGALIIALIPESISLYAYFMNETLLVIVCIGERRVDLRRHDSNDCNTDGARLGRRAVAHAIAAPVEGGHLGAAGRRAHRACGVACGAQPALLRAVRKPVFQLDLP